MPKNVIRLFHHKFAGVLCFVFTNDTEMVLRRWELVAADNDVLSPDVVPAVDLPAILSGNINVHCAIRFCLW